MRPFQSESIDQIVPALIKAQGSIEHAVKDSTNPAYKRANGKPMSYADLNAVFEAAKPHLQANDLFVSQQPFPAPEAGPATMVLRTAVYHKSGQFIASELPLAPAMAKPQEMGSHITYARRYALAAILSIPQEDDDANLASGRDGRTSKPAQPARPKADPVGQATPAAAPNGAAPERKPSHETFEVFLDKAAAHYGVPRAELVVEALGDAISAKAFPDPRRPLTESEGIAKLKAVYDLDDEWRRWTNKAVRSCGADLAKRLAPANS